MNGYVALVAAVCLALLSLPAQGLSCGSVYDGLGNRQFDLNTQSSTSTIAAHWFGFDDDVLNYEWAVASSSLAPSVPAPGTCGQFFKLPDVVDWTNAHRDTSASISTLKLSVGTTYFVLLRITSANGKQFVAASDGVTVVAPKLDAFASETLSSSGAAAAAATTPFRSARSAAAVDAIPFSTCPIDAANRCRQTQKPVGQVLREIYGEPVYNPESPIALLFLVGLLSDRARAGIFPDTPLTRTFQRDFEGVGLVGKTADFGDALIPISESSDDDDGLAPGDAPAWVIAPIIGGIFLCGLLLFCLVLVTRVLGRNREGGSGGSSGGSGGSFAAGAADSAEKKQYAGRNVIGVTNTSDRTDISFPDTAIKRLSITHNDTAVDDLEEATRSPRRKHPIMQSTSSSFRDYRNNG